jgi:purine nucleoside permease
VAHPLLVSSMRFPRLGCLALIFAVAFGFGPRALGADKIKVKVIVLAGFEVGDDTGDAPGEFQFWAEREHLTGTLDVKGAPHPLRFNSAGLYGSVAGNTRDKTLTTVPASELIMAICLDPRLDVSKAYWLITGISGIDPAHGSIGSAVWADSVVDGDAMREIGEGEIPAGWPWGLFAIGTMKPGQRPAKQTTAGGWGGAELAYTMNYPLNPGLTRWALAWSQQHATLTDSPALKAWRDRYTGFPNALHPPEISLGATLASARYWHGEKRTEWARDWVKLWTDGKGVFSTTAMEQAAYVGTLQRLGQKGLVDFNRVLMLRSVSNYCMPPPGMDITATIGDESLGTIPGFEAGYRAGSVVVHELLEHWDKYELTIPTAAQP